MKSIQIINQDLLHEVTAQAQAAPRRRKNYNFHTTDKELSHRLLNAIEPDSYVQPHCHHEITKDETIVVARGGLGVVCFDAQGAVTAKVLLTPTGEAVGVNIPHGVFHTLVALESGSVFFEAKAGPYAPLVPEEKAPWAPTEGDPLAAAYLVRLKQLFT